MGGEMTPPGGGEAARVLELIRKYRDTCMRSGSAGKMEEPQWQAIEVALTAHGAAQMAREYQRGFKDGYGATIDLAQRAAERRGAERARLVDGDWLRENGYIEAADTLMLHRSRTPEAP